MPGKKYQGPVIDAHHHFWDLGLEKHPWLAVSANEDELTPIRKNFLPSDYSTVARKANIVASVHVEANWDPVDPLGEIKWLDSLDRTAGIAARYVAYAPLRDPMASELLEQYALHQRVVGVREILSWHPDPGKSRVKENSCMADPVWRGNLLRFEEYGLSFELLISPWQLSDARRLAEDFPHIQFVLNHCGSPMDRDEEGMRRWSDGLRLLAGAPNVLIKISDPVAYDPDWSFDSLALVILTCIEAFGPYRSMFASDHPVAGLHIDFLQWLTVFSQVTQDFSEDEKAAMFFENARAHYKIPASYSAAR